MTANYVIESIKNGRDLSSEHLIREMSACSCFCEVDSAMTKKELSEKNKPNCGTKMEKQCTSFF